MLEVQKLQKSFGRFMVISDASFSVEKNEVVALLGPNGAGKTTMVNLLSGHLRPDAGKIMLDERDITTTPSHIRIALGIARNFQITQLFEELSVLDNVRNCIFSSEGRSGRFFKPAGAYKREKEKAMNILETFDLAKFALEPASALSEGDKKILDTAMAFALNAKFLLLDEPTSGVATSDKFKVMDTIISAIQKQGTATLIIEHDMDIVAEYTDRVMVLAEGRILADGASSEVMENKEVKETLFGVSD
jgi:branched-chain amino acid transport system ATP-binding protein